MQIPMNHCSTPRCYRWLFWLLAISGFIADQASKYGVFALLYPDRDQPHGGIVVIPDAFSIVAAYTEKLETGTSLLSTLRTISGQHLPQVNQGALFGTRLQLAPETSNKVFMVVSVLAALGIMYWSTRQTTGRDRYLCFALGLILGGTLGNLYDRIVFDGVRDFLWWYKWVNWPVFNLADCWLVCGAGLLLVEAFFAKTEVADKPAELPAVTSVGSSSGICS